MNIEKKFFNGRLNSDINERLFATEKFFGDYIDAYNVLVFSAIDSGIGLVKGFKGTTEISYNYGYSSSSRKVIGREVDLQNKMVYFIIAHASTPNANDGIYRLNVLTKEVELIIKGSFLKLNNIMRITGIDVVDGKYLLYTDTVNEPRNIELSRAIAGELTTESQILAIKAPPIRAPYNLMVSTDTTYLDNNIRGNFFQFKYRYVYRDNTKSVFSPISRISTMGALFMPEVEQAAPWYENNQIEFEFEVINSDVEAVEMAARVGNTGDFGLIDTIENFVIGSNSYVFKNNNILLPIEVRESNLLFDRIPVKSLAQKVVNGSNVIYGGITEGFDIPEIDITADYFYQSSTTVDIDTAVEWSGYSKFSTLVASFTAPPAGITITFGDGVNGYVSTLPAGNYTREEAIDYYYDNLLSNYPTAKVYKVSDYLVIFSQAFLTVSSSSSDVNIVNEDFSGASTPYGVNIAYTTDPPSPFTSLQAGTYFSVKVAKAGGIYTFYYRSTTNLTLSQVLIQLCNVINDNSINIIAYPLSASSSEIKIYSTDLVAISVSALFNTSPLVSINSLKSGDGYTYGIVYSDGKRVSEVITNKECQIDIPFTGFANQYPRGRVFVNSRPPEWATEWYLVRTKRRKYGYFLQFGITTIGQNGSFVEINFNNSTSSLPFYNDTFGTKLSYTFAEGDRLKFIRYKDGTPFVINEDLPILSLREDGALKIPTPKNIELNFSALEGCVVEVYRPNTFDTIPSDNQLFYEIGLSGYIENAGANNRYHEVYPSDLESSQAQPQTEDLSFPLILRPIEGDVWYKSSRLINFTKDGSGSPNSWSVGEETVFCSMYQADKYPIETSSIGRPNAYNKDQKQITRPATMYFSETYFTESDTNGINRIYANSFKDYDQTYGAIKLLHLDGFLLYNFQENRVGAIPVNKQMVFNQDGSSSLILSSELLNQCKYFDYMGGINDNPESFCYNQFNKYFVDILNNAVCKIGGNGIIRISDISMASHFTSVFNNYKQANLTLTSGQTPRFYGAWDEDNKLVIFAPERLVQSNGEDDPILYQADTIAYSENQGGWSTKMDFKPSAIIGCLGELISWSPANGKIWEHNSNETRNLFYGSQKTRSLTFAMASAPSMNKSYLTFTQEAEMVDGERYSSIYSGSDPSVWNVPEISTSFTQESNLLSTDFSKKEGMYYAKFWRDTTTPVANPLINGDQLKGSWIKCKITNDSTDDVGLYSIGIGSVPSKRSG